MLVTITEHSGIIWYQIYQIYRYVYNIIICIKDMYCISMKNQNYYSNSIYKYKMLKYYCILMLLIVITYLTKHLIGISIGIIWQFLTIILVILWLQLAIQISFLHKQTPNFYNLKY